MHLFNKTADRVMNSRMSGQCSYTIRLFYLNIIYGVYCERLMSLELAVYPLCLKLCYTYPYNKHDKHYGLPDGYKRYFSWENDAFYVIHNPPQKGLRFLDKDPFSRYWQSVLICFTHSWVYLRYSKVILHCPLTWSKIWYLKQMNVNQAKIWWLFNWNHPAKTN